MKKSERWEEFGACIKSCCWLLLTAAPGLRLAARMHAMNRMPAYVNKRL